MSDEAAEGISRAAILLLSVGEDAAAAVMKHLSADEVQRLGASMAELSDISRAQVSGALGSLLESVADKTAIGFGTPEYLRKVLVNALGDRKAENLLNRILDGRDLKGIDALRWMDAKSVAHVIKKEHPQIVATILAHLTPEQAAQVMTCLPAERHGEIAQRIAVLEEVPESALEELDEIVDLQTRQAMNLRSAKVGGLRSAADIINLMDTEAETAILEFINAGDEDLGQKIKDSLFIFENLLGLDDRGMQRLLREVQSDVLSVALKGSDPAIADKIYRNMSKRAAEILKDDISAKGPVRLVEVEEAQRAILTIAQQLSEDGEIMLGGGGDDFV